jgi:pSer/pThr/pTyr-binding forkhead associated (FHA) protein
MGIVLRCTRGPCTGETITIDSELVLGRGEPDPGRLGGDSRLSRRHARLFIDHVGRPVVEDLGSTNGTWINEQRLTEARVCANGDVLRLGQATFEVDVPAVTHVDTVTPASSPTVAESAPPTPRLRVVAGPKEGEEIPLIDELLLGRSFGEPGALGGDKRLSRRHARIARGPGGVFFIEDTGSSNGTTIDGVRLRRAHLLKDGDEIELGSSTLEAQGLPSAPLAVEPPPAAGAPQGAPFQPRGSASARLSSHRGRVVGLFAAVFVAAAAIAVAAVVLAAPLGSRQCPSGFVCHPPPTAPPLHAVAAFTGALGWRVEYDPQIAQPKTANASANQLVLEENDAYNREALGASPGSRLIAVLVRGFRASQVSPQAAVQSTASSIDSNLVGTVTAPSSDQLFGSPVLGFHPAVGEVLEGNVRSPQGPGPLVKLAVMSASSGGVTIALAVVYPVQHGQSQQENPDRAFDQFGDQVLETVRFPSDGAT